MNELLEMLLGSMANGLGGQPPMMEYNNPKQPMPMPQDEMRMMGEDMLRRGMPPANPDGRMPLPPGMSPQFPGGEDDALPPNAMLNAANVPPQIPAPGIPLPRPRPQEAPALDAMAQAPGMPMNLAPPPFAQPQGERNFLGLDRGTMRRLGASLGGGLSQVRADSLPGEGLARGLGGSFNGAGKFDKDQDDRQQRLLDTSVRMRGQDLDNGYRMGTLGVAQQNANTSQYSAQSQDAYRRRDQTLGANNRRSTAQDLDAANREIERRMRRFPALPPGASEQERLQHEQAYQQREDEMRKNVYNEYGISPGGEAGGPSRRAPARAHAPLSGEGTGPVDLADVEGQGTQQTPFRPSSRQQYDAMPSGTYYIHRDGSVRLKP